MYELIISPHLDDALFSLSKYLISFKGNIIIATLFTKEVNNNFTGDYALYADTKKRKKEDHDAINEIYSYNNEINITVIHLNLPDELFRDSNTNKFINDNICKKFSELSYKYNIGNVLCPIGVGEHNDHLLTYNNSIKFFKKDKIFFYYDYPYCNLKINLIKRLNSIGIYNNYKLTLNDIYEYYYHPIYQSCPVILRILRIFVSLISYYFSYFFTKKINILLFTNSIDFKVKYNIISKYDSQIKPIFGNDNNLINNLKKYQDEFYLKIE